ncbi:transposase [Myxococcus fulvus]|uniref:transposase n=1 Tax=Myxococcus fulvus TaxID=33 RepID=UPI003B9A2432
MPADNRISIKDPDMRHGRKSKSNRFNGYKQRVGIDLDRELVLACAVTPANRPEEDTSPALQEDLSHQDLFPDVLLVDRAYLDGLQKHWNLVMVERGACLPASALRALAGGLLSPPLPSVAGAQPGAERSELVLDPVGYVVAANPGNLVGLMIRNLRCLVTTNTTKVSVLRG